MVSRNLKIFCANWAIAIISFLLIGALVSTTDIKGFIILTTLGLFWGGLYSFVNYVDDTESMYSYKALSVAGGFFIFLGITFPIFYLKRKCSTFLYKFIVLAFFPPIISMVLWSAIAIFNYMLYPSVDVQGLMDSLYFSGYASIMTIIPALLLGFYSQKDRDFIKQET